MLKLLKPANYLLANSLKLNTLAQARYFSISINQIQFDKVKKDSEYPNLYYYPTKTDNKIILSLLNPNQIQSKSKVLKTVGAIGTTTQDLKGLKSTNLDPKLFEENADFINFMHECLSKSSVDKDQQLIALAQYQKEGWLHVPDQRNPAPWGRIPLPEDILGSLLVQDSKIVPKSYQKMPSHRIVSSSGLFWLSEALHQDLIEQLKVKLSQ